MSEVIINGKPYPVRYGVRFEIDFEETFKTPLRGSALGTRETIHMYWLALKNGLKDKKIDITVENLIDAFDQDETLQKSFETSLIEWYKIPTETEKKD